MVVVLFFFFLPPPPPQVTWFVAAAVSSRLLERKFATEVIFLSCLLVKQLAEMLVSDVAKLNAPSWVTCGELFGSNLVKRVWVACIKLLLSGRFLQTPGQIDPLRFDLPNNLGFGRRQASIISLQWRPLNFKQ